MNELPKCKLCGSEAYEYEGDEAGYVDCSGDNCRLNGANHNYSYGTEVWFTRDEWIKLNGGSGLELLGKAASKEAESMILNAIKPSTDPYEALVYLKTLEILNGEPQEWKPDWGKAPEWAMQMVEWDSGERNWVDTRDRCWSLYEQHAGDTVTKVWHRPEALSGKGE